MSMNFFRICLLFWFCETNLVFAISDKEARIDAKIREAAEIQMWTENLAKSRELTTTKKIELFGFGLRNMAVRKVWPASDDRIFTIYSALQGELLSTPGHAEYFRDKINDARMKMEGARAGDLGTFAYLRGKLYDVVRYDFPVFQELPSPETVRVMGEFLIDERGYYKMNDPMTEEDIQKEDSEAPVFARAAMTLTKLPIESKPVPDLKYPSYTNPEDVKPWRDWIDEIKSGKRTFRFVGDPTEYDLNGPAAKEKVERIAKSRERDAERQTGHRRMADPTVAGKPASEKSERGWVTAIAAGVASLAIAGWLFASRKKRDFSS